MNKKVDKIQEYKEVKVVHTNENDIDEYIKNEEIEDRLQNLLHQEEKNKKSTKNI